MDPVSLSAGAVLGALGGLLGAGVGALVFRGSRSHRLVRLLPPVLGAAVSVALTPVVTGWWDAQKSRSPYETYQRDLKTALGNDQTVRSFYAGMERRGLNQEQANAESRALGARGVARLSDSSLDRRTESLAVGLAGLPDRACARVARSEGGEEEARALFNAMGEERARAMAAISVEGVEAEIRGTPEARPPSTAGDATRLIRAVAALATPEERAALNGGLQQGATDSAVCAGFRVLYRYHPRLPPADRSRLALLLSNM